MHEPKPILKEFRELAECLKELLSKAVEDYTDWAFSEAGEKSFGPLSVFAIIGSLLWGLCFGVIELLRILFHPFPQTVAGIRGAVQAAIDAGRAVAQSVAQYEPIWWLSQLPVWQQIVGPLMLGIGLGVWVWTCFPNFRRGLQEKYKHQMGILALCVFFKGILIPSDHPHCPVWLPMMCIGLAVAALIVMLRPPKKALHVDDAEYEAWLQGPSTFGSAPPANEKDLKKAGLL